MKNGTIKFYNKTKGFGFIEPSDGGKDVFVHATALERAGISKLSEGQSVSYEATLDAQTGKITASTIAIE
jgi:CspA family cold shock protein